MSPEEELKKLKKQKSIDEWLWLVIMIIGLFALYGHS